MSRVCCPVCENQNSPGAVECSVCHAPLAGLGVVALHARRMNYLRRVRAWTCYPVFRALVNASTAVVIFCAVLAPVCFAALTPDRTGWQFWIGLLGFVWVAICVTLLALAVRETSFLVADIADVLIEENSREIREP